MEFDEQSDAPPTVSKGEAEKPEKKKRVRREFGSIKQDDESGRWRARIYMGTLNGERRDARATFDTKQQAQKWLREKVALRDKKDHFVPSKIKVGEWVKRCLEDGGFVSAGVRTQTAASYKKLMENHLYPSELATLELRQLRPLDVTEWLNKLRKTKARKGGKTPQKKTSRNSKTTRPVEQGTSPVSEKTLSIRTVQYCRVILRLCLEKAVQYEHLTSNPVRSTDIPKENSNYAAGDGPDSVEVRAFQDDEIRRFLTAARERTRERDGLMTKPPKYAKNFKSRKVHGVRDRLAPYWLLALETGMRPGELLGLQWKYVNLSNKDGGPNIMVRNTLVSANSPTPLGPPKTKGSRRTIPISAECVRLLEEQKVRQADDEREHDEREREYRRKLKSGELPEGEVAPRPYQRHGLVFATRNGTPMDSVNVSRDFHELLIRAGFPERRAKRARLYDLRHTAITHWLKVVPLTVASKLAGHASTKMTLDVYAHVLEGQSEEAGARIAGMFAGLSDSASTEP